VPLARHDVEQLLDVALDNALRYSGPDTAVTVATVPTGDMLELIVADDGAGLPDEELAKATTRFWRGHDDGDGTGLGLAMRRVRQPLSHSPIACATTGHTPCRGMYYSARIGGRWRRRRRRRPAPGRRTAAWRYGSTRCKACCPSVSTRAGCPAPPRLRAEPSVRRDGAAPSECQSPKPQRTGQTRRPGVD
jgi:hypothetical protein